jgi:hypothetical protein
LPKEHASIDEENTNKETSPTKSTPPEPAPERIRPAPAMPRPKPGFVMPALLVLAAILLPNVHRRHT